MARQGLVGFEIPRELVRNPVRCEALRELFEGEAMKVVLGGDRAAAIREGVLEIEPSAEVVKSLTAEYANESASFREQAIPLLVNDFVYAQPEAALEQDLAAFWKQTCLATDLSSVLGTN